MRRKKLRNIRWGQKIAYAVGLIATDGCLSPDGRHVDLTSKDVELLSIFLKCLDAEVKVGKKKSGYTGSPCYRVQVGSVELYRWLLNIGITPNKTKTLGELNVPQMYLPDFLRGHIDGDGCLRVYQDYKHPKCLRLYIQFFSASRGHLEWIQREIEKAFGLKGSIKLSTRVWKLEYAKKESIKLLPIIYYNREVPCLERKRKIIESFI
jgi:hypothetical protein